MPNALTFSNSPYLQYYAGNPVDWLEWEAAFARALPAGARGDERLASAAARWLAVVRGDLGRAER